MSIDEFTALHGLVLKKAGPADQVAEVWGRTWAGANRTLDVHVATLRTKLGRPELVQTVRGVGYRLGVPDAPVEPDPPVPGGED